MMCLAGQLEKKYIVVLLISVLNIKLLNKMNVINISFFNNSFTTFFPFKNYKM